MLDQVIAWGGALKMLYCGGWISASEDASADAIACLQHDDIAACDTEITRGSQTSGARADDQDSRTLVCRTGKVSGYHYILGCWLLHIEQLNPTQVTAALEWRLEPDAHDLEGDLLRNQTLSQ